MRRGVCRGRNEGDFEIIRALFWGMVSNKVLIMYCLDFMIKVKTIEVIEKIGIVGYNNVYERC